MNYEKKAKELHRELEDLGIAHIIHVYDRGTLKYEYQPLNAEMIAQEEMINEEVV